MVHKFVIPNLFYVPSKNMYLLSPQYWAREILNIKPKEGMGYTTTLTKIQLQQKQAKHKLDIPLSKGTNIATLHLALCYMKYLIFYKETEITFDQEDNNLIVADKLIINDDKVKFKLISAYYA